jgi:hypothetical protein
MAGLDPAIALREGLVKEISLSSRMAGSNPAMMRLDSEGAAV